MRLKSIFEVVLFESLNIMDSSREALEFANDKQHREVCTKLPFKQKSINVKLENLSASAVWWILAKSSFF